MEQIKQLLPDFLPEMLKAQYGEEIAEKIIRGYEADRKVTLRVNTLKAAVDDVKSTLTQAGIEYDTVSWSREALIIKNADENRIMELPVYDNGGIYLQSLSSMLPPVMLAPAAGEDILDMAAAPGGKTTQMAALTGNKAHITACELNAIRARRLEYNVNKQGASCVYVMQKDSRTLDDFFSFGRILLDAPCSGSGVLSVYDANIKKTFTKKLIDKSVKAQTALLKKAVTLLKKGHEMVYSTCSVLRCENEDIVNSMLKSGKVEIVPIDIEGMESIPLLPVSIPGTVCVAPDELYEGFFVAKLRKKQ